MGYLTEFKRRNVHRMVGLYLVAAWLLVQVTGTIFPLFGFGDAPARITVILLAIGFVPALVFAWVFELTPEGLKRESEIDRTQSISPRTGRKMDRLITGVLVIALVYFAIDKFVLAPQQRAAQERRQAVQLDTATEVARSEGRTEAIVSSYGDKSIAVLPFTDMSPGKDQEYMGDGLAEELLNLLAQIPELRVISRSSAFTYKGRDVKLAQIAKELGVAHVLEGSVRKSGHTIRVTAQLIDARSDTHLWSKTYDRPLDDIFAVQDEISQAVVDQLKLKLLGAAPKAKEVNPLAYALYLQARQLGRQFTAEGFEQAIALANQALVLEPGYADAWVGLSRVYMNQSTLGLRPVEEAYALSRDAVSRALASDPNLAKGYDVLGWIAMSYDGDLSAAALHYQRALTLAPTDLAIIGNAATLVGYLGRVDQCITLNEYVNTHDPLDTTGHVNLGSRYYNARRYDEAIASYRTALRLSAGYIGAQAYIGEALLQKGEAEAALAETLREPDESSRLYTLALVYQALGRRPDADASLAELIRKYQNSSPYAIASAFGYRNEVGRAFEWLDRAVAARDTGLVNLAFADTDPTFVNLRKDPRWLPFLRKIGKAPEQLAAIPFEVKLPQR